MPVGFCCDEVKPPGPVQEKFAPVPEEKRLTEPPTQAGPLFEAVAEGAGPDPGFPGGSGNMGHFPPPLYESGDMPTTFFQVFQAP